MRIWDVEPSILCRNHLLGEHRELHALWTIVSEGKKGYQNHPETKRWKGKLKALYYRHMQLVIEMKNRGYVHRSDLDERYAVGKDKQDIFVHTVEEQYSILKKKGCGCKVTALHEK